MLIFRHAGIYPREPRSRRKVSKSSTPSTTYYYSRDIQYLLHEPLLAKFRDHKALAKKISRHLGRGEARDAQRLEKKGAVKLSLDHIVKERYPTFADALRDLDDALSLLFLFANLPSTSTVAPKTIAQCQRLCLEFQHYLITTNSLRKSFLSIKGIYYQATIQGQDVLWLVPYKFVQRLNMTVDFRIMATFVDFYVTLLGFVNFRLYTTIGLVYPPRFSATSDEQGGELGAFTLEGRAIEEPKPMEIDTSTNVDGPQNSDEGVQKQIEAIANPPDEGEEPNESQPEEQTNDTIDTFEPTADDADILPQPQASSNEAASLFLPFTFFLSRETPRQPLEFILRAFGSKRIGWDAVLGDGAFTTNESDPTITHQVVDRPPLIAQPETEEAESTSETSAQVMKPGLRVPGRIYVQPQYVWDCINQCKILRPDLYAPGATLPPHLSPFVKATKDTYDPTVPLAEQEREGEAEEAEGLSDEDEVSDDKTDPPNKDPPLPSTKTHNLPNEHGMDIAGSDSDASASTTSFAGFDEEGEEGAAAAASAALSDFDPETTTLTQHQRELEAEAAGLAFSENVMTKANGTPVKGILKVSKGDEARKRAARRRKEEEEELERRKMMMTGKKRKTFEKMRYSNEKKNGEAERLRAKKRRIEGGRG